MSEKIPILIIGASLLGTSIAYELSKTKQGIYVVEKNKNPASEHTQSARNSMVIHGGPYYDRTTEPLKTAMCVPGNAKIYTFAKKYNIFHRKTGKLIIARDNIEAEFIEGFYKRSRDNGVPNVEILDRIDIKKLEPNINAYCALHVPKTGIVDSVELAKKLYLLAEANNTCFAFGNKVIGIEPIIDSFKITLETTDRQERYEIDADIIINAAGLYFDEIATMLNPNNPYKAEASKNEWVEFSSDNNRLQMNGTNIYPIPCVVIDNEKQILSFKEYEEHIQTGKGIRSLGVHLTPTVQGTISIGPMVIRGIGKEDFRLTVNTETSGQRFLDSVASFFPNLTLGDIKPYQIGNQVKILENGKRYPDFLIKRDEIYPNFIYAVGDSPGLTCVFPIAEYVAKLL
ncbi:MAG: FAD-dependent oxidoreductase [Candidatus Aenigmatarchaeota archaeon]